MLTLEAVLLLWLPVRTVRILNMIQEEPEVKMRIIGIIENKIMGALTPAIL